MKKYLLIAATLLAMPTLAFAQEVGPQAGDREFTLAGTGSGDKNFDNGNLGLSFDLGWYRSDKFVWGLRQSVNYADVKGANISDDYWNGSTRGYLDYHFGTGAARPFIGGSLGGIYGDGVNSTGVAGLEVGLKYYALEKTFILARAEYQFFFENSDEAKDNFSDGAWQYVLGVGYHF
ncbi:outer membrane beta-barrel protein [Pseudomonadota bacterium]